MIPNPCRVGLRLAASAVVALALVVLGVAPALAVAPTIEHQQFVRQINNSCPDFPIRSTFYVDRTVTTYYDADGTPIRQHIEGNFPGEVANLETGYTLPAENVRIIDVDLLTGESRSTGTNVRIWLPGGGTIQLTSGIQIRNGTGQIEFEAGRLDFPPTPELCAALAG
jgi:hypothetical protein